MHKRSVWLILSKCTHDKHHRKAYDKSKQTAFSVKILKNSQVKNTFQYYHNYKCQTGNCSNFIKRSLESDVLTSTSLITEPTTAAPMHKTQSLKWGGCVTHNAAAVPTAKCVFPVISFPFSFPKICNLEVFLILPRLPESQPFYYTLPRKSWQAIPPKFRCFSCIYALLDL